MLQRILSLVFWIFLTLTSILLYPMALLIWAVTLPFDRRKVLLHKFTCFWASLYSWLNPAWPVKIEGRERIRRGEAYVMVANHLSLLDILVIFRLFSHFKWVSKIENFRVPFVGWNSTRSPTGELRAFKPGAFELAVKSRRPILPIAIEGTANALPKRGFVLRGRHPIRITILEEIPAASFEGGSAEQLGEQTRELIAKHLSRTSAA
jgi:1-acyl-sn-glycerol-3-phosphate acyltransferase